MRRGEEEDVTRRREGVSDNSMWVPKQRCGSLCQVWTILPV